jgi:hypothetical protein
LGNSERLGVTGLKTGPYKSPLQNAITKNSGAFRWIAKGAAGRNQGIAGMPQVFVYWTTSVS